MNVVSVHGYMAPAGGGIHVAFIPYGAQQAVCLQRRVKIHRFFLPEEPVVDALKRSAPESVLFVKLRRKAAGAAGDGMLV